MEWIKCSEQMPEAGDEVLVWGKWSTVPFVGWLSPLGEWMANKEFVECRGDCVIVSSIEQSMVTHWMPLPLRHQNNCNKPA